LETLSLLSRSSNSEFPTARPHRVPLCPRAVQIIEEMSTIRQNEYVFPGRKGRISKMPTANMLRRMGYADCTIHGFRSTFRDWAAECTTVPREIAEAALAHVTGSAVERAYRRGDALEKRRELMAAWATFCDRWPSAKVVLLRRRG
jgi:integrase